MPKRVFDTLKPCNCFIMIQVVFCHQLVVCLARVIITVIICGVNKNLVNGDYDGMHNYTQITVLHQMHVPDFFVAGTFLSQFLM